MGWPYTFAPISKEEKHLRRISLDRYAFIAFASSFAPLILSLLVRLVLIGIAYFRSSNSQRYTEIPTSPAIKAQRTTSKTYLISSTLRKLSWWLGDEVIFFGSSWGRKEEWILGSAWTAWLLTLCVVGTGTDYFHLTKRFGIIAVSQMPMQYLLALKPLNPAAFAFASSHEQVNRYHRLLGRIVYFLFVLHMTFYVSYFLWGGILFKKLAEPVVFMGLIAGISFHSLAGTTLRAIRDFSYRLFFITHLLMAFGIPMMVFFHAEHARWYLTITPLLVFCADLVFRQVSTVTTSTSIEAIPGTSLVKITAPLPATKLAAFRSVPGSHVYLKIPSESRPKHIPSYLFEFLFNPFTVAAASEDSNAITLVARANSGPMTSALSSLAESRRTGGIPLCIEGPYGSMKHHLSSLLNSGSSHVLLIAGGVGATFITPLYAHLSETMPMARIQMAWAIRNAGDATWPVSTTAKSLLEDSRLQVYLTGLGPDSGASDGQDGVEMSDVRRANRNRRRPDLKKLIDGAFGSTRESTVAVIVCGPPGMAKDVRAHVRPWVMKGRSVWYHSEVFAW